MIRDDAHIVDMILAARRSKESLEGITFEVLTTHWRDQAVTIYELQVLGEACKRLSDEFRNEHPGIEWEKIAGMRD